MYDDEKMWHLEESIQNRVVQEIVSNKRYTDQEIYQLISDLVIDVTRSENISIKGRVLLVNGVFNAMRKYDVLQKYIEDDSITEIMANGYQNIFIEKNGRISKVDTVFPSETRFVNLLTRIASSVDRVVNENDPIVDARLKDGSRVSIVMNPVALNGPILTVRKFSKGGISLKTMLANGTMSEKHYDLLHSYIKTQKNIMICGGTSSGKTTLLNALGNIIDKNERVITIEDSVELRIDQLPNIVQLETKMNGKKTISISDLLITSLRMRPDRIIIGEVRGIEAFNLLQAMNTGHKGCISTGHSNSCIDMMNRLEMMVLMGHEMENKVIRRQIFSAIDIIIYVEKCPDKIRRISEIIALSVDDNGDEIIEKVLSK